MEKLTQRTLPKNTSKARQKAIVIEARYYKIIANQLYRRGKEKQLRLCIIEAEYVGVLEQAHSNMLGGHFLADTTTKAIMIAGLW